ncbi:MAG: hypothetical protein LAP40_10280 [Acidobacteriia bacterium]|nr:hypothetical protein [Terriglobia bacterium]
MKRWILTVGVLALSAGAFAQSSEEIDKALSAAPARLRDAATVVKWKSDYTYDTVKKGTNNLVCYDRSGLPGQQAFSIECTNLGNLPRAAQNLKFEAMGAQKQAMLDAAEKDGTRVKPEYGSVWYHLMGADKDHARTHMTIAVPGATAQTTGLPESGTKGGVWIMNAGTTTAHLMVPGE